MKTVLPPAPLRANNVIQGVKFQGKLTDRFKVWRKNNEDTQQQVLDDQLAEGEAKPNSKKGLAANSSDITRAAYRSQNRFQPSSSQFPKPIHTVAQHATGDVTNQVGLLTDYNIYDTDPALKETIKRLGANWAEERLQAFGSVVGSDRTFEMGFEANEHPPELQIMKRGTAHEVYDVKFTPAYHELMKQSKQFGLHSLAWTEDKKGSHVARAALMMMQAQAEAGVCCPISMTHAGIAVLRNDQDNFGDWITSLLGNTYDAAALDKDNKTSTTIGMAMTERQGGSDVRANSSVAVPLETKTNAAGERVDDRSAGKAYSISGHKWFCSAPMSDAFLTLAQTENGLSCFLVPRWLPGGELNQIEIKRLKDKMGNKANASSEIKYHGATGYLVGTEGKGVRTIIDMVNQTRLDCVLGSSGLMRQGLVQAMHHARKRLAFGDRLIDKPLMKNVLADLAIESEAGMLLGTRIAEAFDNADSNPAEKALARIMAPVGKYWVTKRAIQTLPEAMEVLGGNGYVEEHIMPRLVRESFVNSIWEGSGNVIALDVLRALVKDPDSMTAFMTEVKQAEGIDARFDQLIEDLETKLNNLVDPEAEARQLIELMAISLEGSLVLRHSPKPVQEAFLAGRIESRYKQVGALPATIDFDAILNRAFPE